MPGWAGLVVVAALNGVTAQLAGELGGGWHYFAPDLTAQQLRPTRAPRQIIGSRSIVNKRCRSFGIIFNKIFY